MVRKCIWFGLFLGLTLVPFWSSAQVKSISFSTLQQQLSKQDTNKITVVNFWATWCGPCLKEMPSFVTAQQQTNSDSVDFIFVSLDFPGSEERVEKVFRDKNLKGTLLMLNEPDANQWINILDPNWQGNIPATWFIAKKDFAFHIGAIETAQILTQISHLKTK
jgi:thiol-disulfide isomerase/thioredoxin